MAGLSALVLGGCSGQGGTRTSGRPQAGWPGYPSAPSRHGGYTPVTPPYRDPNPTTQATQLPGIGAIPRSKWTRSDPRTADINKMGSISKITIHHEGWTPVYFTSQSATADRIEKIRLVHTRDRGWSDIGYHYIVDRAGRVWEGRPLSYQGAHVKNNNPNNIGILVMGNFDKQSPSSAQLKSLFEATAQLRKQHGIKAGLVRSHQEINPTACPGKNMQRKMDALRRHVG